MFLESGAGKLDPRIGAVAKEREHHHGLSIIDGEGLLKGLGEGLGGIGSAFLFGRWHQLEAESIRVRRRFFFRTTASNPRTCEYGQHQPHWGVFSAALQLAQVDVIDQEQP